MKVHYHTNSFIAKKPLALSIGSFDGVHLAHQLILEKTRKQAAKMGAESAVLTFAPHPRITLNKEPEKLRLLNTIDEKIGLMERAKLDHLFMVKFDEHFAALDKEAFVKDFLYNKLNVRAVIVGYDHKFGHNREGDFAYLSECGSEIGFETIQISQQELHDVAISSSKIRLALQEGNLTLANELLGYAYQISGSIFKGDGIGRELGYPTANIKIPDPYKLIPAHGVYAARIELDGELYESMAYIGKRPSLNKNDLRIEVNILDFDREIYGKHVKVHMLERTRGDMQFSNLAELVEQIGQDELEIRKYFNA